MSSEEQVELAGTAMSRPTDIFRSALAMTVEQIRGFLPKPPAAGADAAGGNGADLGAFASVHIDMNRFSALVPGMREMDAPAREVIQRSFDTISDILARCYGVCRAEVPSGGSLRDVVAATYAEIGRAFGAARVVEFAQMGRYEPGEHDPFLEGFPFAAWDAEERRLAPPLIVLVDGGDLHAEALTEFLDGLTRIVLVVRGEAPPAALARLVSPGTFVVQTDDAERLEGMAAFDGPGVAALVPEGAARFTHDPGGGPSISERITIQHLPEGAPKGHIGSISTAQQGEQLAHLGALAVAAASTGGADGPGGSSEAPMGPVDKLAAWLLAKADLTDLS
jgi:hypothetical protein